MRRRLSSRRFRRRMTLIAVLGVAVAAVVGGSILIGNTGKSTATPLTDQKATVYQEPRLHALTPAERSAVFDASWHFVSTAVARRHLDEAWTLLGPEMRAGQTRKSWNTGFNNVVPFPVAGLATWNVLYSYRNDVALDLALIAKPGGDIVGKSFTIELKRYPASGNRWLVASWVPKGISGVGQSRSAATAPGPPPVQARLSAVWLVVPLS